METLGQRWARHRATHPIRAAIEINDEGLVVGAGTVLSAWRHDARNGEDGRRGWDHDRILALLTVAQGRPTERAILKHMDDARSHWERGDRPLAALRLTFARLPKLETLDDAYRLYLAETALDAGLSPQGLLKALGYTYGQSPLAKFNENEARVPGGNGRASGRFGTAGDTPPFDPMQTVGSILAKLAARALAALEAYGTRFTVPTLVFGAIFIPTPDSGGVEEGRLPGFPDVTFKKDGPAGTLRLSTTDPDGNDIGLVAHSLNGLYVDVATGKPIGRDLGASIYVDPDEVLRHFPQTRATRDDADPDAAQRYKPEDGKLCEAPVPDRAGAAQSVYALAYAEYVGRTVVNPERQPPLPSGFGFGLFNPYPKPGGSQYVIFDDCQDSTGRMQEYKGHYADLIDKPFYTATNGPLRNTFLDQADRQIKANDERNRLTGQNLPIDWHFDEQKTADFARKIFEAKGYLSKIRIHFTPFHGYTDP